MLHKLISGEIKLGRRPARFRVPQLAWRAGNYSISSLYLCALGALKILIICVQKGNSYTIKSSDLYWLGLYPSFEILKSF